MAKYRNSIKNILLVILAVAFMIGCSLLSAAAAGGSGGGGEAGWNYTVRVFIELNGGTISGEKTHNTSTTSYSFRQGTYNGAAIVQCKIGTGSWQNYVYTINGTAPNDARVSNPHDVSSMGITRRGYRIISGDEAFIKKGGGNIFSQLSYTETSRPMTAKRLNNDTIPSSGTWNRFIQVNWKPNTLTVNYHSNGASNADELIATRTYNYDGTDFSSSGLPDTMIQDGNETNYWNLEKQGFDATGYWCAGSPESDIRIDAGAIFDKVQDMAAAAGVDLGTGNKTIDLYADWTPHEYSLTFHPSGGIFRGTADNIILGVINGSTDNNDPGAAVRDGYVFKGWFTLPAGGDQVYGDDGRFVEGSYWTEGGKWNYYGDLDLYAHWEEVRGFRVMFSVGETVHPQNIDTSAQGGTEIGTPANIKGEGYQYELFREKGIQAVKVFKNGNTTKYYTRSLAFQTGGTATGYHFVDLQGLIRY